MQAWFYQAWPWIVEIGTVVTIISAVIALWKYILKDVKPNMLLRCLAGGLSVVIGVVVVCSCVLYMLNTWVPDVEGQTVYEAKQILSEASLGIELEPGVLLEDNWDVHISGQSIKEKLAPKGMTVMVYLNPQTVAKREPTILEEKVTVPNVIGMEQLEAVELLTESGLRFQVWWTEENNVSADAYYIIDQSIPADVSVPAGTLVRLELSATRP